MEARSSTDSGTARGPQASSVMPCPNSLGRRVLPERSLPAAVDGPPRAGCPVLLDGGAAVQVPAPGDLRGDPHIASRAELPLPLDQLGRPVDAEEPRGPRTPGRPPPGRPSRCPR